jgi:hypothetical protein
VADAGPAEEGRKASAGAGPLLLCTQRMSSKPRWRGPPQGHRPVGTEPHMEGCRVW